MTKFHFEINCLKMAEQEKEGTPICFQLQNRTARNLLQLPHNPNLDDYPHGYWRLEMKMDDLTAPTSQIISKNLLLAGCIIVHKPHPLHVSTKLSTTSIQLVGCVYWRDLDTAVLHKHNLLATPNDITGTRWWRPYPGCFSTTLFVRLEEEEEMRRPSLHKDLYVFSHLHHCHRHHRLFRQRPPKDYYKL